MKPLHCPFCGAVPLIEPIDPKTEGDAWGMVVCVNHRCPTFDGERGVQVGDGSQQVDERGSAKYKQAAIRRWNRRKPTP